MAVEQGGLYDKCPECGTGLIKESLKSNDLYCMKCQITHSCIFLKGIQKGIEIAEKEQK